MLPAYHEAKAKAINVALGQWLPVMIAREALQYLGNCH